MHFKNSTRMLKTLLHKILLILAINFIFSYAAFSQNWTKVDSTNSYVHKIYCPKNNTSTVIVCADNFATDIVESTITFYPITGNGYHISVDSGKTFNGPFLTDYSVYAMLQDPNTANTWYASARKLQRGGIALTTDNGVNWQTTPLACESSSQIFDMAASQTNPTIFYAAAVNTGEGFLYSDDNFQTCQTNSNINIQSRSIAISPHNPSLIFIAGDAYHKSGVHRSYDGGQNWQSDSLGLKGLRVHCVLPSKYNPGLIYCGVDSITGPKSSVGKGIFQSLDTGKTWKLIGAKGRKVFAIAEHPASSKHLAAACDTAGVYLSGSWGYDWEKHSLGLPEGASVRTIAIPNWEIKNNGFVVFAGLYGEGVYKSNYITASVREEEPISENIIINSISPNPFNEFCNISWYNPKSQHVNISVMDNLGKTISVIADDFYSQGGQYVSWKPSENKLNSGAYFIVIKTDGSAAAKGILLLR